jgi:hypothetical protein
VDVGIDQAWQAGEFSKVMNGGFVRRGLGGSLGLNPDNAIASDVDRLIQPGLIRQPIDQSATMDDDFRGLCIGFVLPGKGRG